MRDVIVAPFLSAAFLILAQGCATPSSPSPPSADVRASLGIVGVVSVGPSFGAMMLGQVGVTNDVGKGALKGLEVGGLSGAGVGALAGLPCGPFIPICVPLFALAGAGAGALLGAGTGA